MDKAPLLIFGAIGLVGYVIFHGHRLNQDCFLCKYRGMTFLTAACSLGVYTAITE